MNHEPFVVQTPSGMDGAGTRHALPRFLAGSALSAAATRPGQAEGADAKAMQRNFKKHVDR